MKIKTKPAQPVSVKRKAKIMSGSNQYERGFINRSFKTAIITYKYVNYDLSEVGTGTYELPVRTINRDNIIKAFTRTQKDKIILKVTDVRIRRTIYTMSEETFIRNAERKIVYE